MVSGSEISLEMLFTNFYNGNGTFKIITDSSERVISLSSWKLSTINVSIDCIYSFFIKISVIQTVNHEMLKIYVCS
jgi:hypothetical protein